MDTGELLGGRYRLTGRIGSGGMGTVYRAHDTRLDRPVAIKTLHGGRDVDDVTRARLRAEARLAGTLRHPGVVQVFDYGEEVGAAGPVLPPLPVPAPSPAPRQRWNRQRLLVIAAAAVVLAGTLGLLALQHRDVPPAGASELDVPAVVGKQAERAVRILDRAGFEVVLEDAGGDVPGQVVKQSPDPGRYDGTPAVTRPAVTLWVTVAASPPPSPTATPRPEPDEKPPATGAGTGKHDPGSGQGHGADKGPGKGPDNGHGKGPGKKHR